MIQLFRRLLERIKRWLAMLLAPAEDPRQTYAHAYERQRLLLSKVQHALRAVIASKERLGTKMAEVRAKLPLMEQQAEQALESGREDLARLALRRYQVASIELHSLEEQLLEVQKEEQRLALSEGRLAAQIEAFFTRQEIAAVRYSAAEAKVQISEAMGGISKELSELDMALQEAEVKAEHMQARASAIDHLVEAGALQTTGTVSVDALGLELEHLEIASAVEAQLAALKAKMGDEDSAAN
jgi:phage shock protein A